MDTRGRPDQPSSQAHAPEVLLQRYHHNLVAHLHALCREIRQQGLTYLRETRGHSRLRTVYLDILATLAPEGTRPSVVSAQLGMNTQYCLDLIGELEREDYVERLEDPEDNRARLIRRTARGKALVRDCLRYGDMLDQHYHARLPPSRLRSLQRLVTRLNRDLGLRPLSSARSGHLQHTGCELYEQLIASDNHALDFVSRYLAARGHERINDTRAWLIGQLLPNGLRVTEAARRRGISSQAMGRTARETAALGYLAFAEDGADRRSKRLLITPRGIDFLRDTVDAITQLEHDFSARLGSEAMTRLHTDLARLCNTSADTDTEIAGDNTRWLVANSQHQAIALSPEPPLNGAQLMLLLAHWLQPLDPSLPTRRIFDSARQEEQLLLDSEALGTLANTRLGLDGLEERARRQLGSDVVAALHDAVRHAAGDYSAY